MKNLPIYAQIAFYAMQAAFFSDDFADPAKFAIVKMLEDIFLLESHRNLDAGVYDSCISV